MPDPSVEYIVKKVLFHLGEIQRVLLVEGFFYPNDEVQAYERTHLVERVPTVEAAINFLEAGELGSRTQVWLPDLSCRSMMASYMGVGGDETSNALLALLLRGHSVTFKVKHVELLGLEGPLNPLISKHHEALNTLMDSGLVIEGDKRLYKTQFHPNRLLNEQHIKGYEREGCIEVHVLKETIVTPLAQDYLRQSPLRIIRK